MANGHGGARPGSGRKSDAEIAQLRTMIASVMTDDDWITILSEIVKDARYGNLRSVSFLLALRYGTVQADQGTGLEFEFIIAAVVGGCLMTGGYGSVIGASLGAAILAMSTTGFQTVKGWNSDARFAFLGGVLLVAVLVNNYVRKKAQEAR